MRLMTPEQRALAFLALAKYTGCEVTADFIRHTSVHCPSAGIAQVHSLAEGIFKPRDSEYAFCVWSRSATGADREIYADSFRREPDGGWSLTYAAKQGLLDSAVNRSLFKCLEDHQPVLVIVTSQGKNEPGGARYTVFGPALISSFDPTTRLFTLNGSVPEVIRPLRPYATPVELEQAHLRSGLVLPFMVSEERVQYVTTRDAREQAFRSLVLAEYRRLCCLCRAMFVLKDAGGMLVEAEAAHIIPVADKGPDDLRNALSLCKRHHWAFDNGLFAFSDAGEALVSPAVQRAERQKFDLEEYDGEAMTPPSSTSCRPDAAALAWHREHCLRH